MREQGVFQAKLLLSWVRGVRQNKKKKAKEKHKEQKQQRKKAKEKKEKERERINQAKIEEEQRK